MPTRLTFKFYGDTQLDRTLENIELRSLDASEAFEALADRFVELEQRQFDTEGAYASGGWAPLSPPYAAWKQRHYPGTKILERTGALKASLTEGPATRVIEAQWMAVGSDVDYGRHHQLGDGVPRRRPVELPDEERRAWVRHLHRFVVTGEVGL